MLRIYQSTTASDAKRYFTEGLAAEDYYTENREIAGYWGGRAAERLGMTGPVERRPFAWLCENRHPGTGEKLTPRTRDDRTVGYDVSFHAPKGVSLLHALTGDDRIVRVMREAADQTMRDLERNTHTRVRLPGADGTPKSEDRHTGELAWASFTHYTARPVKGMPDPHLHIHCFVFNATHDPVESRWKAAQFRAVVRDHPYFQAAYHSRLAAGLETLGYRVERSAEGWDLAGIERALVTKFSRRTAQIEAAARRLGVIDPEAKAELGARTRAGKSEAMTADELSRAWREKLSPDEAAWVDRTVETSSPETAREEAETAEPGRSRVSAAEALDWAVRHTFERRSVETDRRLMAQALKYGLGDVTPEAISEEIDRREDLLTRDQNGERLVTTRAVLAEESAVLRWAVAGKGVERPLGAGIGGREGERYLVGSAAARDGLSLNDRQLKAVEQLIGSRDRVQIVRGGAGTGKTTLLKEAGEAIAHGGRSVHAFAVTSDASRGVLREAGFDEAETLEKLLRDRRVQEGARGQVLWIDEAGMIGTPTMKRLFDVAERIEARVVLSGDTRQHAPVERGDGLRLLEQRAEIRAAEVDEIVRQRGMYKEAVAAMETGDVVKSVELLDKMGAITEIWHPPEIEGKEGASTRHQHLAWKYLEAIRRGESALVVSPTHAEGAEVTAAVREKLKEAGRLDHEDRIFTRLKDRQWTEAEKADAAMYEPGQWVQFHQNVPGIPRAGIKAAPAGLKARVIAVDKDKGLVTTEDAAGERRPLNLDRADRFSIYGQTEVGLAAGDRIRITSGGRTLDGKHRLNSGAMYRVKAFTGDGHIVLDNKGGWVVSKHFGHVAHGYCTTPQAAQGKSVDVCLAAMGSGSMAMSTLEQLYVVLSRGKKRVELVTDKRSSLISAVGKLAERRSATELVEGDQALQAKEARMRHADEVARLKSIEKMRQENERRAQAERSIHAPPREKSLGRDPPKQGEPGRGEIGRGRPGRDRGRGFDRGLDRER